ncbi:hypothetical protein ACJX0J_025506, partial [Zea mays]
MGGKDVVSTQDVKFIQFQLTVNVVALIINVVAAVSSGNVLLNVVQGEVDLIVQHIRTKLGQHDLCKIYPNVHVVQSTFQIRGMHTLIRDRDITTPDFVFYSDRLIRLVVEHGLGHLPFTEKQVITPTGSVYMGVDFCKKLYGVSIVRRCMENKNWENSNSSCWRQWTAALRSPDRWSSYLHHKCKIHEIKGFLLTARRNDAHSVKIKRSKDVVKFKVSTTLIDICFCPGPSPATAPSRAECSVDLKLGELGEFEAADGTTTKEPAAATAVSSASPMKRLHSGPGSAGGAQCPSCAVDGCKADLSKCRDDHHRHKVCEAQSKTPVIVVAGREMRFCQQCS